MLQNEDVSNKTITITTRHAGKFLRFLAKNGFKGLKFLAKKGNEKIFHEGKQSYKRLYKSCQGLSAVDISRSDDIKTFRSVARKYKMDFAVKKDKNTGLYTLFFKAKDKEVYDRVFEKYKEKLEQKGQKKSLKKEIAEKKQEAKKLNAEKAKDIGKKIEKEVTR